MIIFVKHPDISTIISGSTNGYILKISIYLTYDLNMKW